MDFHAFVEKELSVVLENITDRTCHAYVSVFRMREAELSELDNKDSVLLFGLLAEATSMWLDPDSDEPLQPLMVMNREVTATPQNIKDEFIEMLASLSLHIQDAELLARIADILWLRKRDYQAGKIAIKAYVDSARNLYGTENWIVHSLERVERSIHLARQLNDKESLQNVIDYLEELLEESKGNLETDAYVMLNILALLQKHKLHRECALEFASLAERGAADAQQQNNWHLAQQYWEIAAKWYQIDNKPELAQQALVSAAECDVQQAQAAAHETPPRFLAAHAFIEDAITALRRIGGQQARVDDLHQLLIQYGEES